MKKRTLSVFIISFFVALSVLVFTHQTLAGANPEKVKKLQSFLPTPQPDPGANTPPEKTTLESPVFFTTIAEKEVVLKWKAVGTVDHYHVQVATDPNFKWLVVNEYVVPQTEYKLKDLQPNQHYYWRVNAVIQNNESTFRKSGFVTSMFETASQ